MKLVNIDIIKKLTFSEKPKAVFKKNNVMYALNEIVRQLYNIFFFYKFIAFTIQRMYTFDFTFLCITLTHSK